MNLFQKYGIKEVADVVFYSINEIGDEVFYTPVLYLDTLKVSTIEKTAEKVDARGGYGNKKLITWNFGKDIVLNLEDALFSPASMSMIWGGMLESKLSDYTNAIVKCNLANKYGLLHYSIKAYPSPAMTDGEWEVVFKAAELIGLDSGSGNSDSTKYTYPSDLVSQDKKNIEENRITLVKKYFKRKQEISDTNGEYNGGMPTEVIQKIMTQIDTLDKIGYIKTDIHDLEVIDRMEKCIVKDRNGLAISAQKQRENLFRYYADDRTSSYTIFYDAKTMLPLLPVNNGFIGTVKEDKIIDIGLNKTWYFSNLPTNVLNKIPQKLKEETNQEYQNRLNNLGLNLKDFWKDFWELQHCEELDQKIRQGLSNYDDYEILTMESINNGGQDIGVRFDILNSIDISKNQMTIQNIKVKVRVYDKQTDIFKIKIGTVYYKWTRTVKYKEDEDDGILGKTLVIDADTFPDNYKIVGETYIREQKTGKDQRYQFTIFKANVSSDTNVTLEAEGDPTTFSMSIDVLTPPNDIMMEFRQIDVEEDKYEGGTRIVPQRSKYTYTPTNIEMLESVDVDNSEIY